MLTETMIQKDREERARLGPIAQLVGLSLEAAASDRELHAALVCIAERLEERGLARPSATKTAESSASRQPVASATSVASSSQELAGCTLGMQVAERMKAEREGREPAPWAMHPLPATTSSAASRSSAAVEDYDAPTVASMQRILETQKRAAAHHAQGITPTPSQHSFRFRIG